MTFDFYKDMYIKRLDKDGITPYLSFSDFSLIENKYCFINKDNEKIAYFSYFIPNKTLKDKVILFLPGVGPGHTTYMKEIATLANKGYLVYSLDYVGCEASSGDSRKSIFEPSKNVIKLLEILKKKIALKNIILIGHSLGAFTALNAFYKYKNINKLVMLSSFYNLPYMTSYNEEILFFECQNNPSFLAINLIKFLKNTKRKIAIIHSYDDKIFNIENAKIIKRLNNKNIKFYFNKGHGHNVNYDIKAIKYLNETFNKYNELVKNNESIEKIKEYMASRSALNMTIQDKKVIKFINNFLDI